MTARPISSPDAVSAASRGDEGSNRENHNLAEGRRNLCDKCTKVVNDLKPSTPNRWLDFGIDGEGYGVNWEIAKVQDSAKSCDLCRVLVEIFYLDQLNNAVSSGRIDGRLVHLGEHYTLATGSFSHRTLATDLLSRLLSQMLQSLRRIRSPKSESSALTSQRSFSPWRPDVRGNGNWSSVLTEIDEEFEGCRPKTYRSWTLGRQLMVSYNGRRVLQKAFRESENEASSSKAGDIRNDTCREEETSLGGIQKVQKSEVQEAGGVIVVGGQTEEFLGKGKARQKRRLLFKGGIRQPDALIFNSIQISRFISSRSDPESALFVRQISSRRQNIPLIRSWLERCLREHKGDCRSSSGAKTKGRPNIHDLSIRVVDVENECVIKAPRQCRYLALSYVWGKAKQVLLTTTNEKTFACRDGLRNEKIPATIKDAMALCRMLGERYLWVDALCIFQDPPPLAPPPSDNPATDVEFKTAGTGTGAGAAQLFQQLQIRNMDVIYSSAIMTIVNAAACSADDPIPGVRSDAPYRVPPSSVQIGENLQVAATIANAWECVSLHSEWDTRGWTFQEKILSKRLLVVTECFSFFRCPSMLWREDRFEADLFKETATEKAQIWESGDPRGLYRPIPQSKGQEPVRKTLDEYQKLVPIYTTRNFSHPEDVLLAFQGIEQTMKPSVGDFFWGLPKRGFNAALTWTFTGRPSRREGFPSWSWAGWEGPDEHLVFKSDISDDMNGGGEGRITFYQLIAQQTVRRMRGKPPLSLADEDVDVCIINRSWLSDEQDHVAGALLPSETIWRPSQLIGRPTWRAVAEKLGLDSLLLVHRLDQLIVFYAMAIEADRSGKDYNFGYWALNEHTTGEADRLFRRDSPTTQFRQRDWIVVQDFGRKYVKTMLIEWVDNVAYRVELKTRVFKRWFLEAMPERKLIILG